MNNTHIRKVALQDIDALKKIGRQTFEETFATDNSPEDVVQYIDESFSNHTGYVEAVIKSSVLYHNV